MTRHEIGRDASPLVVIDGFAADPQALRAHALGRRFGPAAHHYPGIRAELPADYLPAQAPILDAVIRDVFGLRTPASVIDASFSVVTTPPADLSVRQRLPHCDAFDAGRIALVHFLSEGAEGDGTAFYRHRSTGFEWIDEARAPVFFGQLEAELRRRGPPPPAYIDRDTNLFERIAHVPARANRALVYRSYLLHSGAIPPGAAPSADPATGRLTVTAFLSTTASYLGAR